MADFFSFLKKVPLFADLPDVDLKQLREAFEEIHLQTRETLFSEETSFSEKYYTS